MSNTDFIDDDLIQRRDAVKEVKMGPVHTGSASDIPRSEPVPTGDLNLTPLTNRKEEINSQVATKLDELERLRAKQEALEREKNYLETLRNNQEKYEAGKREMIDHLEKSLIALEREEIVLNQRLELLAETERRFKKMLNDMREFNEEQWSSDSEDLREELNKALVIIDNTRKEYNKDYARLEAMRESHNIGLIAKPALQGESSELARYPRRFWDELKTGLAFSLPLVVVLIVLIGILIARLF
ncbi:MAG: hypothetical protein PHW60_07685 [Kiritimatiellae bacterium]|nr:hypothetical protein [Kiritimatiellia bacterium]